MQATRLSFSSAVVLAITLTACTGSRLAVPPRPLSAFAFSAVATAWVPVAYGDAQVSVPSSFSVVYPGENRVCAPVTPPGALYVAPTATTQETPGCPTEVPSTLVSVVPTRQVPPRYANGKPILVNGVTVYLGPSDQRESSYAYYAPSLGVEVTARGPLAHRVIGTLSRSPRARALAPGIAPAVPASWQSVPFAGLRLSFPAGWPVERADTWNLCGPVQIAIGQGVTLDTDKKFLALPCPAPLAFPVTPSNGVRVDSGGQSPTGSFSSGGGCLQSGGVTACPSSTPDYSVLLLSVTVPGRDEPVLLSIGLAGNGMVARTILYSLQAA